MVWYGMVDNLNQLIWHAPATFMQLQQWWLPVWSPLPTPATTALLPQLINSLFSPHFFRCNHCSLHSLHTHCFLHSSCISLHIFQVFDDMWGRSVCSRCSCSHSGPGVSFALCVFISDPLCFMTVHLWSPCLLVWCACIQALVRAAGSVCGPGGNYGHAPREEADPLSPTLSCSCLSFGVAASPYLIPLRQTTRLSSTFGFFGFQDIFSYF